MLCKKFPLNPKYFRFGNGFKSWALIARKPGSEKSKPFKIGKRFPIPKGKNGMFWLKIWSNVTSSFDFPVRLTPMTPESRVVPYKSTPARQRCTFSVSPNKSIKSSSSKVQSTEQLRLQNLLSLLSP